jgi:hypothetical protein
MPNTVPAAAEGLPEISRRKALTVTGSEIIAALTGLAASTMPTPALPAPIDENAHARIRRLSRELSIAMDEWTADVGEGWHVAVWPKSEREHAVLFVQDGATAQAEANSPAMRLFRKWRKLWDASLKTDDDDKISRLLDKANRLEKRLVAMPVNSPVEFAAKMLAATSFGTFGLGDYEARLTADAVQLVGEA